MAKKKLEGVEAARGVAAMLVVFYHAARHLKADFGVLPLWGIARFGHAGVDFFFVLSGFIIAFVHYRDIGQPDRLKHYLVRRISRVFPFYWVVLLVSLGLLALSTHQSFPAAHDIIYSLLLLPQGKEPIVGVAWTLVFEVLFYSLFAMAIVNRRIGLVLFSSWLVFVVARSLGLGTSFSGALLGTLGSTFCIEFFFGIAAAWLLVHHRLPSPRRILAAGVTTFLSSAILELSGVLDGYGVLARYCYGTASMMLVVGLVECERQGILAIPKVLSIAGRASYSIYLVHLLVIGLAYKALGLLALPHLLPLWITYLLLSMLAIVGGIAVSIWVEHPSIRFFRGLLERKNARQ